jgi:hypothetical protein
VKVEPLEFTSSGGRGDALSRLVKSRFLTFYEVIKVDKILLFIGKNIGQGEDTVKEKN